MPDLRKKHAELAAVKAEAQRGPAAAEIAAAVRECFAQTKSPFLALKRGLELGNPTEGASAHKLIIEVIQPALDIDFGWDTRAGYVQNFLYRARYPNRWAGYER